MSGKAIKLKYLKIYWPSGTFSFGDGVARRERKPWKRCLLSPFWIRYMHAKKSDLHWKTWKIHGIWTFKLCENPVKARRYALAPLHPNPSPSSTSSHPFTPAHHSFTLQHPIPTSTIPTPYIDYQRMQIYHIQIWPHGQIWHPADINAKYRVFSTSVEIVNAS